MRNAYSPIDRLASELTRPKGTGAEFMTELSKKPGYKQAEVEDRDLQTLTALPKMAREDFLRALKAKRAVVPQERVLGGSSEGLSRAEEYERRMSGEANNDVHHEDYTLPGGKNYREILLKHPQGGFEGVPGHFGDEPDILASIRVKDRTGPNGEKILHIEEIQSDWHQQGREKGYLPKNHQELIDAAYGRAQQAKFAHIRVKNDLQESKTWSNVLSQRLNDKDFAEGMPRHEETKEGLRFHNNKIMELMPQVMKADQAWRQAESDYHRMMNQSGVPDAPYKKNWHELALKRMIQHAAEKGYDSIAITPGEEQAKRYGLSKHVSRVTHMTHNDDPDSGILFAFDPSGRQIVEKHNVSHSELPNYIGKEGAQKLLEQKPDEHGYRELKGQNLDVGGEGMKGFYDKMVPKFLNQFGKKYGAQVQPGQINTDDRNGPSQTAMLRASGIPEHQWSSIPYAQKEQMLAEYAAKQPPSMTAVHTFPITPAMREDVMKNGIPLYAKGGSVEEDDVPRETVKAYKLFRVDKKHPGKLFPLFIGKHEPVDMGKWVPAEHIPTKGFAERPGWHAGDLPMATHIGEKSDTSLTAPDRRPRNQVWTEIEMPNDVDWQTEANKRGTNQHGRVVSVKAHITDQVPTGGHYRYKTNPNMTGSWLIGGSMKVNRILHDKEVKAINRAAKQADLPRHEPFDPKEFGFAEGGAVSGKDKFLEDSKERGVMYHGTDKDIKDFRPSRLGTFVTPDPEFASKWATDYANDDGKSKEGANVLPVHVQVKNPFDYEKPKHVAHLRELAKIRFPNAGHIVHSEIDRMIHPENAWDNYMYVEHPDIQKLIKAAGHDAFYASENHVKNLGVYDPRKIKSAIGNRGTYDTNEADITKAKGGAVKPAVRGIIKERVTVSPDKDVMMYELMSAKRFTKKVK